MYKILGSLLAPKRFLNLKRNIHLYNILSGTHYDTLKLPRNCTTREVRDSFIKLSKQCHPDKNRDDPNTHAQFVKLNEAYSILSRSDKRRIYDLSLKPISTERFHRRDVASPYDVYTTAYRQRVVWRDESFWEYKDKTAYNDYSQSAGYYGIKGVKRVPNGWIALMCVVFAAMGVWLQVFLIRHSTAFSRQTLDERSEEASKILSHAQEQARIHGNKVQLELLKQRQDVHEYNRKTTTSRSAPGAYDIPSTNKMSSAAPTVAVSTSGNKSDDMPLISLGYLADMPTSIERNNLEHKPEAVYPKPVLCIKPDNLNIEPEQITVALSQNMERENEDKFKQDKFEVLTNIDSDKIKKNDSTSILMNIADSGNNCITSKTNEQFSVDTSKFTKYESNTLTRLSSNEGSTKSSQFELPSHNVYNKNPRSFIDANPDFSDQILVRESILMGDSGIFSENLILNKMR